MKHILLVEDDLAQNELIKGMLEADNYHVYPAICVEEAILLLKQNQQIELVFTDWKLGNLSGLDLLNYIRNQKREVGVVVATAYGSIEHAALAIEKGADDYLSKPFQRQELLLALAKADKSSQLRNKNKQLNHQLSEQNHLVNLIGHAPCMQKVFNRIEKVSATSATVLISGESGTGKELAARALHQLSNRSSHSFIAVNCGAIPDNIAESELFGSKKGAFTGAVQDKVGKFEAASKGTIFLDEIAELSLTIQAKLLRLLQEGTVTPLGCNEEIKLDLRIIAASHQNLQKMVDDGLFREDLYYRLNVVPINMPALRERKEDIPRLVQHFIHSFSNRYQSDIISLPKDLLKKLITYSWPGNVRQLSNTIERFILLQDEEELLQNIQTDKHSNSSYTLPEQGIIWSEFEKDILLQALNRHSGNKTQAAKILGISYKQFLYRLEKHNIV